MHFIYLLDKFIQLVSLLIIVILVITKLELKLHQIGWQYFKLIKVQIYQIFVCYQFCLTMAQRLSYLCIFCFVAGCPLSLVMERNVRDGGKKCFF